ncbi:hypothetical protein JYT87_03225, partial [Nitrospira defluvii]|nr:hypothetical protein [Nitrospira defluvii]
MSNSSAPLLPFQPVILWTDGLIYLLIVSLFFFGLYVMRREHLRAPWRQIRRRPLVVSALVVFLFYIFVGLCDSFHFRRQLPATETNPTVQYAPEVLSFLDVLVESLRMNTERTYSAPLATYAFTKEMIEAENGTQQRAFPRLKFGGAHLADPQRERAADLLEIATRGAATGLVISIIFSGIVVLSLSLFSRKSVGKTCRAIWRRETETAWSAILLTVVLIIFIGSIVIPISGRYHLFGTDKVGQDVLYLALKGVRTGLVIGALTTLVMLPFAIFLGLSAGYFRGWIDDVIQYLYTTLSSVPGVLLIASAILILQVYMDKHADAFSSITERADMRLLFLCIILGMTGW